MVTYKGKQYPTVQAAADETGDKYSTVYARVQAATRKVQRQAGREVNRLKKDWTIQTQVLKGQFPNGD